MRFLAFAAGLAIGYRVVRFILLPRRMDRYIPFSYGGAWWNERATTVTAPTVTIPPEFHGNPDGSRVITYTN